MTDRGRRHPGNTLNDLTGKEWLALTRTWFETADAADLPPDTADALRRFAAAVADDSAAESLNELPPEAWLDLVQSWFISDSRRYWRNKDTELHPARFPEEMIERFVTFFTKAGEWVLDPFLGSGATLVTCQETGRHGVGVEVNPRYAETAAGRLGGTRNRAVVLRRDIRRVGDPGYWDEALSAGCPQADGRPQFDFVITSPPYWNMLRTSRGNVVSTHQEREAKGLDTWYSDDAHDLGNLPEYQEFIDALGQVFASLHPLVRPGRYLVIVCQNLRVPGGEVKALAWDLARRVGETFLFQGEQIWCQNTKKLGIWGYPKVFVPNYHHHYCLIFRRRPEP